MRDLNMFQKIIIYLMLIIWLIITGYPIIFLLQSSFKGNIEFFTTPVWSMPASLKFNNYRAVVIDSGIYKYFINSIIVCAVSVFLIIFVSSLAGYAIARINFRFSNAVFMFFVAGNI